MRWRPADQGDLSAQYTDAYNIDVGTAAITRVTCCRTSAPGGYPGSWVPPLRSGGLRLQRWREGCPTPSPTIACGGSPVTINRLPEASAISGADRTNIPDGRGSPPSQGGVNQAREGTAERSQAGLTMVKKGAPLDCLLNFTVAIEPLHRTKPPCSGAPPHLLLAGMSVPRLRSCSSCGPPSPRTRTDRQAPPRVRTAHTRHRSTSTSTPPPSSREQVSLANPGVS